MNFLLSLLSMLLVAESVSAYAFHPQTTSLFVAHDMVHGGSSLFGAHEIEADFKLDQDPTASDEPRVERRTASGMFAKPLLSNTAAQQQQGEKNKDRPKVGASRKLAHPVSFGSSNFLLDNAVISGNYYLLE